MRLLLILGLASCVKAAPSCLIPYAPIPKEWREVPVYKYDRGWVERDTLQCLTSNDREILVHRMITFEEIQKNLVERIDNMVKYQNECSK